MVKEYTKTGMGLNSRLLVLCLWLIRVVPICPAAQITSKDQFDVALDRLREGEKPTLVFFSRVVNTTNISPTRLLKYADDTNPNVRFIALLALSRHFVETPIARFHAGLSDNNRSVRSLCALILADYDAWSPKLLRPLLDGIGAGGWETDYAEIYTQKLAWLMAVQENLAEDLTATLSDGNLSLARAAAIVLCRSGLDPGEHAKAILTQALHENATQIWLSSAVALSVAEIKPVNLSDTAKLRMGVVDSLNWGNTPALGTESLILTILKEGEHISRCLACQALARLDPIPSAVLDPLLQAALYDDRNDVRVAATDALAGIKNAEPTIVKQPAMAIRGGDVNIWIRAGQILWHLDPSFPPVVEVLADELVAHRLSVMEVLISNYRIPTPEMAGDLIDALRADDWEIQRFAAEALGRFASIPSEAYDPLLQTALSSDDNHIREVATRALIGVKNVEPALIEQLAREIRSKNANRWIRASQILWQLDTSSPPVVEVLADELVAHRLSVMEVLISNYRIPTPEMAGDLTDALRAGDYKIQRFAAEALGRPASTPSDVQAPLLRAALFDYDSDVREAATRALARISNVKPTTVEQLAMAIRAANVDRWVRAGQILWQLDPSFPPVAEVLADGLITRRLSVVEVLISSHRVPTREMAGDLTDALHAADKKIRKSAAKALDRFASIPSEVHVSLLHAALSYDNVETRGAVTKALMGISDAQPALVEQLATAIRSRDVNRWIRASQILWQLDLSSPPIVEVMADKLVAHRLGVMEVLILNYRIPSPEMTGDLTDALRADDYKIRRLAAKALDRFASIPTEAHSPLLQAVLYDDEDSVFEAATEALAGVKNADPEQIEQLAKVIRGRDIDKWIRASRVLLKIDRSSSPLAEIVTDRQIAHRLRVVQILTSSYRMPTPEVTGDLVDALRSSDWKIRKLAAEALGRVASIPSDVQGPLLHAALSEMLDPARAAAAEALAGIKNTELDPSLIQQLTAAVRGRDVNRWIRAVQILWELGLSSLPIAEVITDRRITHRLMVLLVLTSNDMIRTPEVAGDLIDALRADDRTTPESAAKALSRFASIPSEARVPLLQTALLHHSTRVREAAAEALTRIKDVEPALIHQLAEEVRARDVNRWIRGAKILRQLDPNSPLVAEVLADGLISRRLSALEVLTSDDRIPTAEMGGDLTDALHANAWEIRRSAAMALSRFASIPSEAHIPLLQATLSDDRSDVHEEVIEARTRIKDAEPTLILQLAREVRARDVNKWIRAAIILGQLDPNSPLVAEALTDGMVKGRLRVVEVLTSNESIPSKEMTSDLLSVLHTPGGQKLAITALSRLKPLPNEAAIVLHRVFQSDRDHSKNAMTVLIESNAVPDDTVTTIIRQVRQEFPTSESIKAAAYLLHLMKVGCKRLVKDATVKDEIRRKLITSLDRQYVDSGVWDAFEHVEPVADQKLVEKLELVLRKSGDWDIQEKTAGVLRRLHHSLPELEAGRLLAEALPKVSNMEGRQIISSTLTMCKPDTALVTGLQTALTHADPSIRQAGADVLLKLGQRKDDTVPEILIKELEKLLHFERTSSLTAFEILCDYAPKSPNPPASFSRLLCTALTSRNGELRHRAAFRVTKHASDINTFSEVTKALLKAMDYGSEDYALSGWAAAIVLTDLLSNTDPAQHLGKLIEVIKTADDPKPAAMAFRSLLRRIPVDGSFGEKKQKKAMLLTLLQMTNELPYTDIDERRTVKEPGWTKREVIAPIMRKRDDLTNFFDVLVPIRARIEDHPVPSAVIGSLVCLILIVALMWIFAPLALLQFDKALSHLDVKVPVGSGATIRLSTVVPATWLRHSRRVLDAWVKNHMAEVRSNFENNQTVQTHQHYVKLPVTIDNSKKALQVEPALFADLPRLGHFCILIKGEGGAGKTSLACQLGRWAIAEERSRRFANHLMIPVMIEEDFAGQAQDRGAFLHKVKDQLRNVTSDSTSIPDHLFHALLRKKRIVVIVDRFSEMSDMTRKAVLADADKSPVNGLIVTSRQDERLGERPRLSIELQRIMPDLLSPFVYSYLDLQKKSHLFAEDLAFVRVWSKLADIVGRHPITPLLATMYIDLVIASKEGSLTFNMPQHLPDLMLCYINRLNMCAADGNPDNEQVQKDAKLIAWLCLRERFQPDNARRDEVIEALGGDKDAKERLSYLERRLRVVVSVGSGTELRITIDPLAEYLAAMFKVEQLGNCRDMWQCFLSDFERTPEALRAVGGFLKAFQEVSRVEKNRLGLPPAILAELDNMIHIIEDRNHEV